VVVARPALEAVAQVVHLPGQGGIDQGFHAQLLQPFEDQAVDAVGGAHGLVQGLVGVAQAQGHGIGQRAAIGVVDGAGVDAQVRRMQRQQAAALVQVAAAKVQAGVAAHGAQRRGAEFLGPLLPLLPARAARSGAQHQAGGVPAAPRITDSASSTSKQRW
jgi:hypothetical protein